MNNDKILLSSEDNRIMKIKQFGGLHDNMIPKMESHRHPIGIVRASSERDSGSTYGAYNAFNNESSASWQTEPSVNAGWISYEFTIPKNIVKYSIENDGTGRKPTIWTFEGSNDGYNWNILDSRKRPEEWVDYKVNIFDCHNSKTYKIYRINITESQTVSSTWTLIGIKNIQMFSSKKSIVSELTEQNFINHGMSFEELDEIDFSSEFTEKHYIQNQFTPLGKGKVFEQPLDVDKIIKNVKIT